MNHAQSNRTRFPFPRHALGLIAAAIGAASVVAAVLLGLGAGEQLTPMLATGLVSTLAAVIALLPISWLGRRREEGMVQGAMAAMTVRLMATFAGAGAAGFLLGDWQSVAGWTLGWYLLFLALEVTFMVRCLNPSTGHEQPQGGSASC